MEYLRLSWRDIEEQCIKLAEEIKRRGINFDLIVGLARGGLVPARVLCDLLNYEELYTVGVKFYTGIAETGEEPRIIHPVQIDITAKRVLLVDDIADTGQSLILAKKHLEENRAREVAVATLVKKPQSEFTPDFFVRETGAWVIFPWEVREAARMIASKHSGEELKNVLEKAEIQESEVKEAFDP